MSRPAQVRAHLGYLDGWSDPVAATARLVSFSGELAFDVGANTGHVAANLAQRFTKVVAFEPAVESFSALKVAMEAYPNVEPLQLAVSDHTGTVELRAADVAIGTGQLVT